MNLPPRRESAFEYECRRLLGITGKEFLTRMATDDFPDRFDRAAVVYLQELIVTGATDGENVSQ